MTDQLLELPPDPLIERRRIVQQKAADSLGRRVFISRVYIAVLVLAFAAVLVPLGSVLITLIHRGVNSISLAFLTSLPTQPSLVAQNAIGGIGNAIEGTLIIDGLAALVAIPIALLLGLYLSESYSRPANFIRGITEIMTGLPSILMGVFAYIYIVVPMKAYSGLAGIVALGVLMVPVIAKASELAFRGVPSTLREAGLALGARSSKVTRGVITGVLLSLARAMGETAPLLLVIGASGQWTWNPQHAMSALPLLTYLYSGSQYPSQQAAAWGVALTLVFMVMVLAVGSRVVSARMRRERR
jgi:phosphate transport system permease protein